MTTPGSTPPRSSLARLRALGRLGSGLGFAFAWTKLRGLFAREARRRELVERYHAESAKRVLAISGHEHEQGRLDIHQALNDGETVEARHLDVEEDEVGLVGLDLPDRLAAIGGGGHHLDVLMGLEPKL